MKNIEIDEELYQHIASNTQYIGESASSILRRLINLPDDAIVEVVAEPAAVLAAEKSTEVVETETSVAESGSNPLIAPIFHSVVSPLAKKNEATCATAPGPVIKLDLILRATT